MENIKKYELTDETIMYKGRILHRIRALIDFGSIKSGDVGGWIESTNNLSQTGQCWIYGSAKVCDNAEVCGDAIVCGSAIVCDNAKVCGNS